MSTPTPPDRFAPQLRTVQIIGAALVTGVTGFLILVVFLVQSGGPFGRPGDVPILTYIAMGLFALQVVLWQALPPVIARQHLQQIARGTWTLPGRTGVPVPPAEDDADKLLFVYQTQFIIGMALLESAGFLACVAYLVEGDFICLIITGLVILLMLSAFPFRERVQGWIDRRLTVIEDMRRHETAS